ncbi:hypothetical protein Btru_048738 [Bulinus truncatus]|nr:hypothetical protein Btru_048738 [Bulinus truncatus]
MHAKILENLIQRQYMETGGEGISMEDLNSPITKRGSSAEDDARATRDDDVKSYDQISTSVLTDCQTSINDQTKTASGYPDFNSTKRRSTVTPVADTVNTLTPDCTCQGQGSDRKTQEKDKTVYSLDSLINIVVLENSTRAKRKSGHPETKNKEQNEYYNKDSNIRDSHKYITRSHQKKTNNIARLRLVSNSEPNLKKAHNFTKSSKPKVRHTKAMKTVEEKRYKTAALDIKTISHEETRCTNKRDTVSSKSQNFHPNNKQDNIVANKAQSFRANKMVPRSAPIPTKLRNSVHETSGLLTNVRDLSQDAKRSEDKIKFTKTRNGDEIVDIMGRQRIKSRQELAPVSTPGRLRAGVRLGQDVYQTYARVTSLPRLTHVHSTVRPRQQYFSDYERPYTKYELAEALPRKSFFCCHEKALREAGVQISARPNRTSAHLVRNQPALLRQEMTMPEDGINTGSPDSVISNGDSHTIVDEQQFIKSEVKNTTLCEEKMPSAGETAEVRPMVVTEEVDLLQTPDVAVRKKSYADAMADSVVNEPLFKYLEYVKRNQKDFLQYMQTIKPTADDEQNSFIKLGHAFELRHHGGSMKISSNDIVVLAANILRHRTSHHQGKFDRAKEPNGPARAQAENVKILTDSITAQTQKDDLLAKTELEKRRLKAEEWARSVNTHTLNRTKQLVLKQLGSPDHSHDVSWETLQNCQYLRHG